jgi:hypothetical protein
MKQRWYDTAKRADNPQIPPGNGCPNPGLDAALLTGTIDNHGAYYGNRIRTGRIAD